MTVEELIAELQKLPGDLEVVKIHVGNEHNWEQEIFGPRIDEHVDYVRGRPVPNGIKYVVI